MIGSLGVLATSGSQRTTRRWLRAVEHRTRSGQPTSLTAAQLNEPEPVYPLTLAFCPRCTLVQIRETVPPEVLFREYLYFSSFSDTMLRHADWEVDGIIADDTQLLVRTFYGDQPRSRGQT